MSIKTIKQWDKELAEAASSFDAQTFKEFYRKWVKRGIYEAGMFPEDPQVLEITMRKIVMNHPKTTEEKKNEARRWLLSRGFDLCL